MPQAVVYNVVALASTNVPSGGTGGLPGSANEYFSPGTLPQPLVDGVEIQNGQYFALTDQTDPNQNGVWYADPAGPVPVSTNGGPGGLNPNITVIVGPGSAWSQNAGTTWVYSTNPRNVTITPGEGTVVAPGLTKI